MLLLALLLISGGAFILILAMLFEAVIFSSAFDDPVMGKGLSVVAGWLAYSAIFGFVTTGGNGFNPRGFTFFAIPAVLVLAWNVFRGIKVRAMQAELEAGLDRPYDMEAARPFE